MAAFFL